MIKFAFWRHTIDFPSGGKHVASGGNPFPSGGKPFASGGKPFPSGGKYSFHNFIVVYSCSLFCVVFD
jgi:hypothetical protein